MPNDSKQLSTVSGGANRSIPSSCKTSAEPVLLVILRLPCLATGTPAAAMARAAAVLILKVWEPSPPVPQVSTSGRNVVLTGRIESLNALAAPVSSSTVSPFSANRTRNLRIASGSASPLSNHPMASCISVRLRF